MPPANATIHLLRSTIGLAKTRALSYNIRIQSRIYEIVRRRDIDGRGLQEAIALVQGSGRPILRYRKTVFSAVTNASSVERL